MAKRHPFEEVTDEQTLKELRKQGCKQVGEIAQSEGQWKQSEWGSLHLVCLRKAIRPGWHLKGHRGRVGVNETVGVIQGSGLIPQVLGGFQVFIIIII